MAADPTILDAFVVQLGWDRRDFDRGRRDISGATRRTAEEAESSAKRMEAAGKRSSSYFSSLKSEVIGLYLAFAGSSSLKSFVGDILSGDAATGRLATNLGIATTQLSAWEGAITRVGGQAADADNALRSMVAAFQSYRLTGTTGHDADFQGLGVTIRDLSDPTQALLRMAEAGERLGRPEFVARLQRIGIPDSTIILLEKGRKGVEALLEQQRRLGVVNDRDAAAAQRLQDRVAALGSAIRGAARGPITDIVDKLNDWIGSDAKLEQQLPAIEASVGGVTVGIAAMTAELWVIPVAIGAIAAAVVALKQKFDRIGLKGVAMNLLGDAYLIDRLVHGDWAAVSKSFADINKGGTGLPAQWYDRYEHRWRDTNGNPAGVATPATSRPAVPGARQQQSFVGLKGMLIAAGLDETHASGIAAGLMAESKGDPNGINPKSGAWGIAQWLGGRAASFRRVIGRDLRGSSLADQIRFLLWELHGGDRGGRSVLEAQGAGNVLSAFIQRFERPRMGYETSRDLSVGASYLGGARLAARSAGGGQHVTHTGDIVINLTADPGADGKRLVSQMDREMRRRRGLVTQANGGLQ